MLASRQAHVADGPWQNPRVASEPAPGGLAEVHRTDVGFHVAGGGAEDLLQHCVQIGRVVMMADSSPMPQMSLV